VSAFSPAWLALREPADRAARNPQVLAACAKHFAGQDTLHICDLGTGTGASLRAFAELLPARQHWTLVDHDPGNLAAAVTSLSAWSDESAQKGSALSLRKGGKHIDVNLVEQDFARGAAWPHQIELVTASALIDLTSAAWIANFVKKLAVNRTSLLVTLTFDGEISTSPPHELDATVAKSFRKHQSRDKGFGPAAGADAARVLEQELARTELKATVGDSPWKLSPSEMLNATADGIVAAVKETGDVAPHDLAAWLSHTRASTLTVGHRDIFAV